MQRHYERCFFYMKQWLKSHFADTISFRVSGEHPCLPFPQSAMPLPNRKCRVNLGFRIQIGRAGIPANIHCQKLGIGANKCFNISGMQETIPFAGDPVVPHPFQLQQRTHHRIVLHGADDTMITRFKQHLITILSPQVAPGVRITWVTGAEK